MWNIFRCRHLLEDWAGWGGGRSPNPTLGRTLGFWAAVPTRPWEEEGAMSLLSWRGEKWIVRGRRRELVLECMKVSLQRMMIHKRCWQRWLEDFVHHQNNDCNFCREAIFCIKLPWSDTAAVLKNQIVRCDYNEYSRNCQLLKNNWMTDPRIFERDAKTNFYHRRWSSTQSSLR